MVKLNIPPLSTILIKNIQIYAEKAVIKTGYLFLKNGKIASFGPMEDYSEKESVNEFIDFSDLPGYKAVPGMIDLHIHGVNGADTMDATHKALTVMAESLPKEGTTSFLATTITQETAAIEKALQNAGDYISHQRPSGSAEVLGIHLEGPFINSSMAGAQPKQYIKNPNLALFKEWQELANQQIKVVTLAPEQPGGIELIQHLKQQGIVASIGHSNATYEQVNQAIAAGASQVTHLFNQMTGLHHREPGVVGAALLREELKAEIIVDGIHIRPEVIKLVFNQKKEKGLILITDSMRAKCLKNGIYELGGQEVVVENEKATLMDGTLAGSILKMNQAIRNIISITGCSLEQAIEMGSLNPAKQLKIDDKKGSIEKGKDADIVILNELNEVMLTICQGKIAYNQLNV